MTEEAESADEVGAEYGYGVRITPVGPIDDEVGAPTQLAAFSRTVSGTTENTEKDVTA